MVLFSNPVAFGQHKDIFENLIINRGKNDLSDMEERCVLTGKHEDNRLQHVIFHPKVLFCMDNSKFLSTGEGSNNFEILVFVK